MEETELIALTPSSNSHIELDKECSVKTLEVFSTVHCSTTDIYIYIIYCTYPKYAENTERDHLEPMPAPSVFHLIHDQFASPERIHKLHYPSAMENLW